MDYETALINLNEGFKQIYNNNANIRSYEAQLQQLSNAYQNAIGKKPNLLFQSIIIFLAGGFLIGLFFKRNSATVIGSVVLILAVILNCVRARVRYSRKNKLADNWWEATGKPQALELNKAVNSAKNEINVKAANMRNNPLYVEIPEFWRNYGDFSKIYNLVLKYNVSLHEAVYMYMQLENARERREEEREWRNEITASMNQLNEQVQRNSQRRDFLDTQHQINMEYYSRQIRDSLDK